MVPAKANQVSAVDRFCDFRDQSASIEHEAESAECGQTDNRLAARHSSRDRRQEDIQVEPAATLEARARQKRPNRVVARHAGPRYRQVSSQCQREIHLFLHEERDRLCENQRRLLRLSGRQRRTRHQCVQQRYLLL